MRGRSEAQPALVPEHAKVELWNEDAIRRAPAKSSRHCELHRHGTIRIEEQPGGRTSIVAVRIVNRAIQKKRLDLTAEEFAALDAGLTQLFRRRAETSAQLVLDLPRTRSEPELVIPLPRGPRRAQPKHYFFRRRSGSREG